VETDSIFWGGKKPKSSPGMETKKGAEYPTDYTHS